MIRVWIENPENHEERFEAHDFYGDERMGERDRALSFILRRELAAGRELEYSWKYFAPGDLDGCAACADAASMAALGWDDYYCRVHRSARMQDA